MENTIVTDYALVTGILSKTNIHVSVRAYNPKDGYFDIKIQLLSVSEAEPFENIAIGDKIMYSKDEKSQLYRYKFVKNISAEERIVAFNKVYPELVRRQR